MKREFVDFLLIVVLPFSGLFSGCCWTFFPSPNSLKVDVCSFICEDGADSEISADPRHPIPRAAPAIRPGCCFPPSSQAGASLAAVHNPALRNRAASPNARPNALQPLRHQDSVPPYHPCPPPQGQSWKPSAGRDMQSTHAWSCSFQLSEPAEEHGTLN